MFIAPAQRDVFVQGGDLIRHNFAPVHPDLQTACHTHLMGRELRDQLAVVLADIVDDNQLLDEALPEQVFRQWRLEL
ncbi:hypothetical protein D3C86_2196830 [compost metagenome]